MGPARDEDCHKDVLLDAAVVCLAQGVDIHLFLWQLDKLTVVIAKETLHNCLFSLQMVNRPIFIY